MKDKHVYFIYPPIVQLKEKVEGWGPKNATLPPAF